MGRAAIVLGMSILCMSISCHLTLPKRPPASMPEKSSGGVPSPGTAGLTIRKANFLSPGTLFVSVSDPNNKDKTGVSSWVCTLELSSGEMCILGQGQELGSGCNCDEKTLYWVQDHDFWTRSASGQQTLWISDHIVGKAIRSSAICAALPEKQVFFGYELLHANTSWIGQLLGRGRNEDIANYFCLWRVGSSEPISKLAMEAVGPLPFGRVSPLFGPDGNLFVVEERVRMTSSLEKRLSVFSVEPFARLCVAPPPPDHYFFYRGRTPNEITVIAEMGTRYQLMSARCMSENGEYSLRLEAFDEIPEQLDDIFGYDCSKELKLWGNLKEKCIKMAPIGRNDPAKFVTVPFPAPDSFTLSGDGDVLAAWDNSASLFIYDIKYPDIKPRAGYRFSVQADKGDLTAQPCDFPAR